MRASYHKHINLARRLYYQDVRQVGLRQYSTVTVFTLFYLILTSNVYLMLVISLTCKILSN